MNEIIESVLKPTFDCFSNVIDELGKENATLKTMVAELTSTNTARDAIARDLLNRALRHIVANDPDMDEYSGDCKCVRCCIQRFLSGQQHP